jgi:hypothetical protein
MRRSFPSRVSDLVRRLAMQLNIDKICRKINQKMPAALAVCKNVYYNLA